MRRDALTEEQWCVVKPLLPRPCTTGRPRRDTRQVVNGILWIIRTGAPWRDSPERFGPWQSVYHWFNHWSRDGTWDRVLETLQTRLDAEGRIEWDLWCVDGSNIRASRAAAGAGKKGAAQNPKTMRWAARAADMARSSTWLLTVKDCLSRSK
jgi:transposase